MFKYFFKFEYKIIIYKKYILYYRDYTRVIKIRVHGSKYRLIEMKCRVESELFKSI